MYGHNKGTKMETASSFDVTLTGTSKELEDNFAHIASEMNRNPIHISKDLYKEQLTLAQTKYEALEASIRSTVKRPAFRPNASSDCVSLFTDMGAKLSQRTPKGGVKMDEGVLENLSRRYPIALDIMKARKALGITAQLRKWGEFAEAGVAQPVWDQFGTPMGRMSCAVVALQNRVMEVRKTVVPEEGFEFVSLDVSQMEYRMWASLSQDPTMKAAFLNPDKDFHQTMGELVAGYFPKGTDLRKAGKTINFALCYKMQASTLAGQLGCSVEQADKIMEAYAQAAPDAILYRDAVVKKAIEAGEVSTAFGRVRKLSGLRSPEERELNEVIKTAWHHHNAGTAAELFKWLMVQVDTELDALGLKSHVKWVINMHDEFILEVRKGYVSKVIQAIESCMILPKPHWVKLAYTITTGMNWADLDS